MVAIGAGEGAANMAEELVLQQVVRDRRAVDGQEQLVRVAAPGHAAARATSSLPVPDSPVISTVLRVGPTLRIKVLTACIGGLSPTSASRSLVGVELSPQCLVFQQQPAKAHQAVDLGEQVLEEDRLHQVVVSPALKCGDGVFDRGIGRDHDEQRLRPDLERRGSAR